MSTRCLLLSWRSDATQECTRKFAQFGFLGPHTSVLEGFWDGGSVCLSSLDAVLAAPTSEEVLCVHRYDEALAGLIARNRPTLPVRARGEEAMRDACRVLQRVVLGALGGPAGMDEAFMDRSRADMLELQGRNDVRTVELGQCLGFCGTTRHRALLFKALADSWSLPSVLVRDAAADARRVNHTYNVVACAGRHYIVDLLHADVTWMEVGCAEARAYRTQGDGIRSSSRRPVDEPPAASLLVAQWSFEPVSPSRSTRLVAGPRSRYAAIECGRWRDHEVAVKTISANSASYDRQQMEHEARALASLHHANVVRLLCLVRGPEGIVKIVTPWARGGDLAAFLTRYRARLSVRECAWIALQVARALVYCHDTSPSMVHRDVKPHNVLVQSETPPSGADTGLGAADIHVALCDFGLARPRRPDSVVETSHPSAGTTRFKAPEQVHGGSISSPVDVWACGVLLVALFSEEAFNPARVHAMCQEGRAHADTTIGRDVRRLVPVEVQPLVLACLAYKPRKRPTMAQVCCRLVDVLAGGTNEG